ncbi:S41 family peptidase [Rhodohalobacter sulfatireducens]|uniref:Tricorn protease homolog n=1 Tax=Rhodohalobacter sulfatireducens TaxID=2911366 RepID=A0ABS9KFM2_9BACT|nr:S41 family peptidase [Rhodohalobacter sulfatireducens]MCG2589660.1 PDZ domain-containing protein [Rhodohalobacter sulfatireducens]
MKNIILSLCLLAAATIFSIQEAVAQIDARMLRQPDVSETHVTFSYADDIWIVSKQGGVANRLTSAEGPESFPRFSPDGSMIAFNANYDGNTDIYVVPTTGGIPKRLTHHPMGERVLDWFPDGESVLFASSRESGRQRFSQFYKVSAEGGMAEKLPVPYGEFGTISPDGNTIAYTPKTRSNRTWKRYRGGMAPDIWLFDLESYESENITDNPANDELPMWNGETVYFLSDQGENQRYNIWAYNNETGDTRQVTNFTDFDIHFPAIGPNSMTFEAGGRLYLMDLASEEYEEINVDVITDQLTVQSQTEDVSSMIQDAYISPGGERVLFQARGDIFSVPAENGPILNLTKTSGVAERYPAWSPDGKYVAYWSDQSGEYELTIRDEAGSGEEQTLTSTDEKFKYYLHWSPDSEKLVFVDNSMRIRMYNMETDEITDIDQGLWMYEGGLRTFSADWSSDSKWVTYSRGLDHRQNAIFLFDAENSERHQVTSGYYHDRNPVFDPDDNYLYLLTSRTFSPQYSNMDNTWIYANSTNVAAIPLREDVDSPLAPKNDEVPIEEDEEESDEESNGENDEQESEESEEVVIDLDGFEDRLVELPVDAGNYGTLSAVSGKVVYLKLPRTGAGDQAPSLAYFDMEEREEQSVMDGIFGYQLSADDTKVLVAQPGNRFGIIDLAPGQSVETPLRTNELSMTVDPQIEWQQIFDDSWRFVRDFFYDPNLHGVDWDEIKDRYQAMLDDAVTRTDVNYVLGEMIAELDASHTYRGGGDVESAETRGVGLLGIDWSLENGAYRVENIIEGAQWDNEVRSPLDMPGVEVSEGDYILAVNGERLDPNGDPYAAFQGLAGKTVELTVNDSPDIDGARKVVVETMSNETRLRHLAWMESNRKRVEEATDGRVGYIYVRSTGIDAQNELVRQFMAQHEKDALIIDERFNSGGQIPDRFIELLNRPELAYWAVRDGKDWKWSPVAHFGPKVMLINGWSGSGGDAFPAYFKETGLGPLIGTTTWGGLIGISGSPSLVDGGQVTVPTFRMYYPDGEWFPEGGGVQPDIQVVDDPTQLANGTDPQLERAIEETLRLMEENPDSYTKPERPAYEDRSGNN